MRPGPAALLALALLAPALLAGCTASEDGGAQGSARQDNPTYFSRAYTVTGKADTEVHTFNNPGGQAYLSSALRIDTGQVTLTLKDAGGKVVFQQTFTAPSSGYESGVIAGAPGRWTLEVQWLAATARGALSVHGSR